MENYIESIKGKPEIKVLFVCLGNICRSPAAEAVMLKTVREAGVESRWIIDSAGTGDYHIGDLPDSRMRAAGSRRGIPMTHRCRQIKPDDFYDFDLIIGMDAQNLRNLHRLSPSPETDCKILPMAAFFPGGNPAATPPLPGHFHSDISPIGSNFDYVPDPYYEGAEGFELVLDMLQCACGNLLNYFDK